MKSAIAILALTLCLAVGSPTVGHAEGTITADMIAGFEKQVSQQPDLKRIVNAVTNNDIKALSLNRDLITTLNSDFNVKVDGSGIVDQKGTGRCWMFAGTNVLTPRMMGKSKQKDFKLSHAYLSFWDKLEKANFFLESMIKHRDKDITDRVVQSLLDDPVGDGGWWNYFEGLVTKYGVVPASAMPATNQSDNTGRVNALLSTLLRRAAGDLQRLHADGKKLEALRRHKEAVSATSTGCWWPGMDSRRRSSSSAGEGDR
jgi:bleomycin hydrolase